LVLKNMLIKYKAPPDSGVFLFTEETVDLFGLT